MSSSTPHSGSSPRVPAQIDDELLALLRCPIDRSPLRLADAETLGRLNRAIALGSLVNVSGEKIVQPLAGGLVRAAGDLLYPIVDEIPVMLADEAIGLDGLPL